MKIRRTITISVSLLAAATLCYLIVRPVPAQLGQTEQGERDVDDVRLRASLANKIVETGQVESASSVELRSELKEAAAILKVVPEGTQVKKGHLVVQLDSSGLESELSAQKIKLATAEAELHSAEEELSTARQLQEAQTAVDEARLAAAIRRQKSYLAEGGEFALESDRLKVELQAAQTRVEYASKELKRLEQTAQSEAELSVARLALSDARANAASLEASLRLLEQHEKPDVVAAREIAVLEAKVELVRNRGELTKRVQVAQSGRVAAGAARDLAANVLEDIRQQIASCAIRSPQDGVVVYANQFSRRGSADFQIEEGAMIRPRQAIIKLPDMSRLQLRVAVNETKIAKVRVGQPVRIQVDALADVRLKGRVTRVNQYPEPAGFLSGDIKQYAVIVSIIDPPNSIRLGMTAFAAIDASKSADK